MTNIAGNGWAAPGTIAFDSGKIEIGHFPAGMGYGTGHAIVSGYSLRIHLAISGTTRHGTCGYWP